MSLPTKNSACKSVIWNVFITNGKNYKNNRSYHNAWCRACVQDAASTLRTAKAIEVSQGLGDGMNLPDTEEYWQGEGEKLICYTMCRTYNIICSYEKGQPSLWEARNVHEEPYQIMSVH